MGERSKNLHVMGKRSMTEVKKVEAGKRGREREGKRVVSVNK
jgi:hypothetical protein